MASGVSKTRVGSVYGTGAAIEVRGVEFRPRKVELYNVSSGDKMVWMEGMADDSGVKTVAAGATTVPTTGGVTPRSDGFDIGTDADVNASGELIRWVAHE